MIPKAAEPLVRAAVGGKSLPFSRLTVQTGFIPQGSTSVMPRAVSAPIRAPPQEPQRTVYVEESVGKRKRVASEGPSDEKREPLKLRDKPREEDRPRKRSPERGRGKSRRRKRGKEAKPKRRSAKKGAETKTSARRGAETESDAERRRSVRSLAVRSAVFPRSLKNRLEEDHQDQLQWRLIRIPS